MSSNTFPPVIFADSLPELEAVHIAELMLGTRCYVLSEDDNYYLVENPSLVPNGTTIVQSVPGAIVGKPGALWATEAAAAPPVSPVIQTLSATLVTDQASVAGAYTLIAPELSLTFVTGANPLLFFATVSMFVAVATASVALFLDGAQLDPPSVTNGAGAYGTCSIVGKTAPLTAGSHTIELRWKQFGGGGMTCNAATNPDFFGAAMVIEEVTV